MLSERQLQNLLKVFEERMQDITEDYLTRMGKHLRDIGRLTDTDVHRVIQMKRVNKNLEHIKARIARAASMSIKDVERVFEAVAESDYRFAATTFGEDHAPRVKDNKYLERIIKAQLRATAQEFKNLSQTTIMSEGYKNAVDVAVQTVQAGLTDYNSAIRKAMKAAAQEGLRVQYPNSGLTRRLDTAIRQNVLDGIRSINQDVLKQAGKEFGADGVEISAHALCAQDHLPYQGRQFEQKEFDRLQNNLDRPFGMWNCKHTVFPILVGISEPAHTEEELQAYIRNSNEEITIDGKTMSRYEWTQHQRKLETAVRYQKDIAVAAKASGDMVARRECAFMIRELNKRYEKISSAAGLIEKPERMRVTGYRHVKPVVVKPGAAAAERNTFKSVSFNEKASYTVHLKNYSKQVNDSISNACRDLAIKGSETQTEHMYLVNLSTGKLEHYETNDNFGSVGYLFRRYLKEHTSDKYAFVHNHNTDSSISETDMATLLTTKQIPVMIAVRNDGIIYAAERKGEPLNVSIFDNLYKDDLAVLRNQVKSGIISPSKWTRMREETIVNNLLRDYTLEGMIEFGDND